jgi:hypothetical protein
LARRRTIPDLRSDLAAFAVYVREPLAEFQARSLGRLETRLTTIVGPRQSTHATELLREVAKPAAPAAVKGSRTTVSERLTLRSERSRRGARA